MKEDAEKLLMMFIKDAYTSPSGRPCKATGLALMKYVASDQELQNIVNSGDAQAILKYRAT